MLLLRFRGISRKEITYIKNSLCASLAASRPQGNGAGEYQQTEQKRREIADAGKEGRRQLMRHKTIDIPCLLMRYGVEKLRSEEHTSELQSLMRTSYAVFCLQ